MKITGKLLALTLAFLTLLCSCNNKKTTDKNIDNSGNGVGTDVTEKVTINPDDKAVFENTALKDVIANTLRKSPDNLTYGDLTDITGINISYYAEPIDNTNEYRDVWAVRTERTGFNEVFDIYYNTPKEERDSLETPLDYCFTATLDTFDNYNDIKLLTNLKNLSFSSEYTIIDINPFEFISNSPGLESISIYNFIVPNLEYAGKFTNLRSLSIGINRRNVESIESVNFIEDLTPLKNLTKLETLSIYGSIVYDLSPIEKLPNLSVLSITDGALCDISPVAKMENLTSVTFDYNGIKDISPLSALPKLETINLDYNYIRDLTPFENLNPDIIKYVSVDMNPINNDLPLRHLGENKVNLGYDVFWDQE